ncbi:MAG: BrnA antitoxin family protein [Burkholderiaceae bacterium]|nr:BrnA antitoxin family protein [Burkholderiaceae bacterium]
MSSRSKRKCPDIPIPSSREDAAINAAAKSDPHAQPLSVQQLAAMVPIKALRGRPKAASRKQLVSVRYSPEVLAYFRSTGQGWQSRMDRVLRDYVAHHARDS